MDCRGSIDDCVRSIDRHQHSPEISKSRIGTPEYGFAISSEPLSESCLQYVSTRMRFREKGHDDTPCQAQKNAVLQIYRSGHSTGCTLTGGVSLAGCDSQVKQEQALTDSNRTDSVPSGQNLVSGLFFDADLKLIIGRWPDLSVELRSAIDDKVMPLYAIWMRAHCFIYFIW